MSSSNICPLCKKEMEIAISAGESGGHPECLIKFASQFKPHDPTTGLKKWLEEKEKKRNQK